MRKDLKKLTLSRETLRNLEETELMRAAGRLPLFNGHEL